MRLSVVHIRLLKVIIHLGALLPVIYFYTLAINDELGGDPVKAIIHFTGIGAFHLLLLTLTVSPLAKATKQGQLVKVRRLLGLYAFAYALLHLTSYLLFELQLEWQLLLSEIIKRPYITVGFTAFVILLLLACTSTQRIQRRMGKRWQKLHNFVYLAILLVGIHYLWSVKSDWLTPGLYLFVTLLLLAFRHKKLNPVR